jgi:hypothetical protein
MFIPLHYQVSEYDCVPTAFINAIGYLFERNEIPPMIISHIYLYSLDTVGRNARFGIGGTSKYAVRLLGNWLSAYKMKKFSVTTDFLEKDAVHLRKESRIHACLEEGGIALCNILLSKSELHYLMIIKIEDDWIYCFDSYKRISLRGMKNHVMILPYSEGRSPNLKIRTQWMDQEASKRFCLGPVSIRECLLIWRT